MITLKYFSDAMAYFCCHGNQYIDLTLSVVAQDSFFFTRITLNHEFNFVYSRTIFFYFKKAFPELGGVSTSGRLANLVL